MDELKEVKKEIEEIKERNKKVETDKAWETSGTRKITIACVTYIVMVIFMTTLKVENVLQSALIPTAGYLLSTLSISFIKKWWVKNRIK